MHRSSWENPAPASLGRRLGGGGNGYGRGIMADGGNNVLATGEYDISVNFGGSTLTSPGATDTFLVKLGP